MDKNTFGTYIKEKRTERGLTQKELADALMIDVTAVSKWERGVNYPDITMIPELCRRLEINEHELIESSNDTESRTMRAEAKRYRRLKNALFYGCTAAYILAVVTCLIVNLSVNRTLSWSFLVAAGCLCGFTFVPTALRFFQKYRLPVFLVTTFCSMALLFLTCCIYTHAHWLWVAVTGVLLGYFGVFYPILFARQKAYLQEAAWRRLKRFFWLTYGLGLLFLTALLLICVGQYTPFDLQRALKITAYGFTVLLFWGLIDLLPVNRPLKLGLDSFGTAAYLYGLNGVLNHLLEEGAAGTCYRVDFTDWNACSDGNVALLVLGVCLIAGIVLTVVGLCRRFEK